MAIPKISDLILYVNKAIRGVDWNTNWQKVINWLTGGNTDINVNSVTTNSISNSGTISSDGLNVNGNADISGDVNVGGVISGDGGGLTNIRSTSTIAYTPFAVNKGYIDRVSDSVTYGQEILMQKKVGYNNIIEFSDYINENFPLTCTTSDGVTFTLEQLDDFDVSNQADGTFVVCVKKGQQRAELKEGVYRQRLAPTDNSIPNNTLWLNISVENIQCYEKSNNNWETKYDGVPIGEVVVSGGQISSLKTYYYNWNGYDVNVRYEVNINQLSGVITKTYVSGDDWYIIWSNGLVEQGGKVVSSSDTATITYHKPLSAPPFHVNLTMIGSSSNQCRVNSKGNTSMVVYESGAISGLLWEVKGFK